MPQHTIHKPLNTHLMLLPLPPPLAPVDPEHAESATSNVSG